MVVLILIVVGLCLGSFVNALVWRVHEQEELQHAKGAKKAGKGSKKPSGITSAELSITRGRSMCTHCKHPLAAKDLIPVLSWAMLRGKCRYCGKKIEDTPLVELATAGLFVASYIWWPVAFDTSGKVDFMIWLVMLTGFMALLVYDLRWMILPNRIIYPLIVLAAAGAIVQATLLGGGTDYVRDTVLSLGVAGGLFYVLFQVSKGKWIGGGDVKLGFLIGFLLASPWQSFLMLFTASLVGMVVIMPGLITKRLTASSHVPFGPFLIIATILIKLFGATLVAWYEGQFLVI